MHSHSNIEYVPNQGLCQLVRTVPLFLTWGETESHMHIIKFDYLHTRTLDIWRNKHLVSPNFLFSHGNITVSKGQHLSKRKACMHTEGLWTRTLHPKSAVGLRPDEEHMTARSLSTVLGKGTAGPAQADWEQNTALKPFIGFIGTTACLTWTMKKTKSLWSDAGEQAYVSGFVATEQLPKIGALPL